MYQWKKSWKICRLVQFGKKSWLLSIFYDSHLCLKHLSTVLRFNDRLSIFVKALPGFKYTRQFPNGRHTAVDAGASRDKYYGEESPLCTLCALHAPQSQLKHEAHASLAITYHYRSSAGHEYTYFPVTPSQAYETTHASYAHCKCFKLFKKFLFSRISPTNWLFS